MLRLMVVDEQESRCGSSGGGNVCEEAIMRLKQLFMIALQEREASDVSGVRLLDAPQTSRLLGDDIRVLLGKE